jgi:hypothetical protein
VGKAKGTPATACAGFEDPVADRVAAESARVSVDAATAAAAAGGTSAGNGAARTVGWRAAAAVRVTCVWDAFSSIARWEERAGPP